MANESQNTRSQALSSLMWRFLERFGAQGVIFVVSIILARLLDIDRAIATRKSYSQRP